VDACHAVGPSQSLYQQRGDCIPSLASSTELRNHVSPLAKHGRDAHLIANVITTLLDYTKQRIRCLYTISNGNQQKKVASSDYCFYIDNWRPKFGKERIS